MMFWSNQKQGIGEMEAGAGYEERLSTKLTSAVEGSRNPKAVPSEPQDGESYSLRVFQAAPLFRYAGTV
jgi:hypothetical protein